MAKAAPVPAWPRAGKTGLPRADWGLGPGWLQALPPKSGKGDPQSWVHQPLQTRERGHSSTHW